MDQTKPGIGRDATYSVADQVTLRALNAAISAALTAEAAGGFDLAARKAKCLADQAGTAFAAINLTQPSGAGRMATGIRPN